MMLSWFSENIGSIIILIVLILIVLLVVRYMINKKKKGGSCGCDCGGCSMSETCHSVSKNIKEAEKEICCCHSNEEKRETCEKEEKKDTCCHSNNKEHTECCSKTNQDKIDK